MRGHCQHNLYICHCNPSSQDPSPIHPSALAAAAAGSSSSSSNGSTSAATTAEPVSSTTSSSQPPVYVTQTSVAVMTSPTLNSAAATAKPASASLYSLMGADNSGVAATDEEETTGLIAAAHCNTLPRVIVSAGGRSATITAANAFATAERCKVARHNGDNSNRLTMFSTTGPAAATLRRDSAGGVTMTSHALMGGDPAVDKYLECLWQPSVAAATNNNGRHQQQMSTVSGNLGDGNGGRLSRYNSHDLLQHHHLQQQQHHQQHHPQSGINSVSSVLLQPPRTCLERVVFALLTLVLVIIFLVAALVFLYLGSGVGGLDGGYGSPYDGGGGRDNDLPSVEAAGLNVEDGIDIVRIKTTEEVLPPASLGSSSSSSTSSGHHSGNGDNLSPRTVVRTKKVCVTPECSQLSRRLLGSVNPDRDPCHSFYDFACGGWMARNQPPPRRMVHSVMSQTRDEVDAKLRDLIEKIDLESPTSSASTAEAAATDRQLRVFYDSCMDTDSIRAKGSVPAVQFLHSNFSKFILHGSSSSPGGTDSIISSTARRDLLTELVLQLLLVNGTPLMDVSLDLNPRDPGRFLGVIRVPQRSAMLPRLVRSRGGMAVFNKWVRQRRRKRNSRLGPTMEEQLNIVPRQEIFRSFQTALNAQRVNGLVKTAETMGVLDPSSEKAKQADMDEILGFLAALEKILPSEKKMKQDLMSNAIYNQYTVDDLQSSFRFLNWRRLMTGLFPRPLESHEVVLVHNPVYMRKLGRIIALFEPRVIWKSLLVLYSKDVLSDLVTVHMHGGQTRWQYCTQVSSMLFGETLSRLYLSSVPLNRRNKILRDTESIFESVRGQVLSAVSSSPFLHHDTRARAADKVRSLRGDFLGSPIYFNSSLIRARYGDLARMRRGDFFSNVMSMFAHFRASVYHFLTSPVDPDVYTWNLVAFPFTVNAFHLQQLNSIVIPLGVILDAHYTMNVPKYLNLGSLGLTLAHEILHSVDQTGRDFTSSGSLGQWWDQNSELGYANATSCLLTQYPDHFRRPLRIDKRSIYVDVDGEFTLSENVCDVDGMGAAERVFKEMPGAKDDQMVYLPNNPYTPQQLFFINAAQSYCSHLGPVSYVLYLELDEHAPNPERVDGLMMNSQLFSSVFQCPVGSRMNPKVKCRVWTKEEV